MGLFSNFFNKKQKDFSGDKWKSLSEEKKKKVLKE